MKRFLQTFALPVGVIVAALAQTPTEQNTPNLELRISLDEVVESLPQVFTFLLVNISDHDLRVHPPPIQCSAPDGFITISIRTPKPPTIGVGCAGDRANAPPILEIVATWTLLRPTEAITIRVDPKSSPYRELFAHYDFTEPGDYQISATYIPPYIKPADREILRNAGIDVPRVMLKSPVLAFVKTNKRPAPPGK